MKVFISYKQSETKKTAEAISLCLLSDGHKVFLDENSLPVGGTFDNRIRDAVEQSDFFIFLLSPGSVAPGSYTLTELKYAQKKWVNPDGYVLPVLAESTDFDEIPSYLQAVNILKPKGNTAAEVCAIVAEKSTSKMRKRNMLVSVVLLVATSLSGLIFLPQLFSNESIPQQSLADNNSSTTPPLSSNSSGTSLESLPLAEAEQGLYVEGKYINLTYSINKLYDIIGTEDSEWISEGVGTYYKWDREEGAWFIATFGEDRSMDLFRLESINGNLDAFSLIGISSSWSEDNSKMVAVVGETTLKDVLSWKRDYDEINISYASEPASMGQKILFSYYIDRYGTGRQIDVVFDLSDIYDGYLSELREEYYECNAIQFLKLLEPKADSIVLTGLRFGYMSGEPPYTCWYSPHGAESR